MAEQGTDKVPTHTIGVEHATSHGDQRSGEPGEVGGKCPMKILNCMDGITWELKTDQGHSIDPLP